MLSTLTCFLTTSNRYKFIGRRFKVSCEQHLRKNGITWEALFPAPGPDGGATRGRVEDGESTCFPLLEPMRKPSRRKKSKVTAEAEEAGNNNTVPVRREVHRVRRAFVVSAGWDNNYHHFIVDCLSRLVRPLNWLLANPDMYVASIASPAPFASGLRDRDLQSFSLSPQIYSYSGLRTHGQEGALH
jgi:hypothetical protein